MHLDDYTLQPNLPSPHLAKALSLTRWLARCEMAFWPSYPACIMSGSNLKGVEYIHKKRFAYPPPLQELEDLVAASMVEVLSSRSEIGQLRRKCDRYDECIDKWKKKASALQKQCQDLNQVY